MVHVGVPATSNFFVEILKACCCPSKGRLVHAHIVETGIESNAHVGSSLIAMYAKYACFEDACNLFDKSQNVVSLTTLISGYIVCTQGLEALNVFEMARCKGVQTDAVLCVCLVQACSDIASLEDGRLMHIGIMKQGFDSDGRLGNALVDMYTKCSSLSDARKVFDTLPRRDVISWSTIIAGYADHRLPLQAIQLFQSMLQEGIDPNKVTFLSILRVCSRIAALDQGMSIHFLILNQDLDLNPFIGSALIDMYVKCRCLEDAHRIFEMLPIHDVVSVSCLIAGYSDNNQSQKALSVFKRIQSSGCKMDKHIFICALKSCTSLMAFGDGKLVHTDVTEYGLELEPSIASQLVAMYIKSGSLEDAISVFDLMQVQDCVSCSLMIPACVELGHVKKAFAVFEKMMSEDMLPDETIYLSLLKASSCIAAADKGKLLHFELISRGLEANCYIASAVVTMYSKCDCLGDARRVFDSLQSKNLVLWNAMITKYAKSECYDEALELLKKMQEEGVEPSRVTFLCMLGICSDLGALEQGRIIHALITVRGLPLEQFIGNALIDMYSQGGNVRDAQKIFDSLMVRDIVSWSALIKAHADQGNAVHALQLFGQMLKEAMSPNEFTFVCIIKVCSELADVYEGNKIYCFIIERAFESNLHIASTLIDMYAKSNSIQDACGVFDVLPSRNVVSWSSLISACAKCGHEQEALVLLHKMDMEGIEPNEVSYILAMEALSILSALVIQGKLIHCRLLEQGLESDVFAVNSLVAMYAKCGSLNDACNVFDKLPDRNVVSWNAIIAGFADHGQFDNCQQYFIKMQLEGFKPDTTTFVSLMSSCSHSGLLQEGAQLILAMSQIYGLTPAIEHHICMVDMLGRAGFLSEAEQWISKMQVEPTSLVWMALLGSCAKYKNIEIGQKAFDYLKSCDCNYEASYVLMSNIYSANCLWRSAEEVKQCG